jgi:hypothetical protein
VGLVNLAAPVVLEHLFLHNNIVVGVEVDDSVVVDIVVVDIVVVDIVVGDSVYYKLVEYSCNYPVLLLFVHLNNLIHLIIFFVLLFHSTTFI